MKWLRRLRNRLSAGAFADGILCGTVAERRRVLTILGAGPGGMTDLAIEAISLGIDAGEYWRAIATIAKYNLTLARWGCVPSLRAEFNGDDAQYLQTQTPKEQ